MVLTVNIGNTNITLGGYEEGAQIFCGKLHSDLQLTEDEYAIRIRSLLHLYGQSTANISGAILGSVVPMLTARVLNALTTLTDVRVLRVGPGLKSGLKLRIDNPAQLGADLLCGVVAAVALPEVSCPVVVISVDTAMSMMAANAQHELVGGAILPGPSLSLTGLVRSTAQLPQIDLSAPAPASVLGTNTTSCLQSGVLLGYASMLDGMADRFRAQLGEDTRFYATGSMPIGVRKACRTSIEYKESLISDGLYAIWARNRKA